MIADIRKRLSQTPFRPFAIRITDGREYPVPTLDHIWIPPGTGRVMIADDEGVAVTLSGLHINGIVDPALPSENGAAH